MIFYIKRLKRLKIRFFCQDSKRLGLDGLKTQQDLDSENMDSIQPYVGQCNCSRMSKTKQSQSALLQGSSEVVSKQVERTFRWET